MGESAPDLGDRRLEWVPLVVERESPSQQLEGHDTGAPHICLGSNLGAQNLRGLVPAKRTNVRHLA
jgi:hypothetical protein